MGRLLSAKKGVTVIYDSPKNRCRHEGSGWLLQVGFVALILKARGLKGGSAAAFSKF